MGRHGDLPVRRDRGRDWKDEVQEELAFHLRARTEELIAGGLSPDEAGRRARAEFGDMDGTVRYCAGEDRRRVRRRRLLGLWRASLDELTLAVRSLVRRPRQVLAPGAILALAIGLNVLVFTVVRGVLLSPLPFTDQERVLVLREVAEGGGLSLASYPVLDAWRREARTVEGLAGYLENEFILQDGPEPRHVAGALVTAGFFDLLDRPLLLGTALRPEDHHSGAGPAAVISEGLWRAAFAADPAVLDRPLRMDGRGYSIRGVVRGGARLPEGADVWLPVEPANPDLVEIAGAKILVALGRLRPGFDAADAEEELGGIAAAVVGGAPRAEVTPVTERFLGSIRAPLLLLQAAVLLVLLAACANAGGMLLARGVRRRSELAVRTSVGAGAGRVAAGLVLEGLILGITAGVAGLVGAAALLRPALSLVPNELPRAASVALDPLVALVALGLAVATGLATSLGPAISGARTAPGTLLREGGSGSGTAPWLRGALEGLVVLQVALAVLLTAGAGLLLRSFVATVREDPGFDPARVTLVDVSLPSYRYPDAASRLALARDLLDRAGTLPGAEAVALGRNLPVTGSNMTSPLVVEGSASPTNAVQVVTVTERYFEVLRIPMVAGQVMEGWDREGSPPTLIVDATVRTREGGPVAVGDRARSYFGVRQDPRDVVAVAGPVRHAGLRVAPVPVVYEPFFQRGDAGGFTLLVRSDAPPAAVAGAAARLLRSFELPADRISTLSSVVRGSVAEPRFYTVVLSLFGGLAVILALAGCQAGLAHRVAARRREIGLRMALGASASSVRSMVVRRGVGLAGVGAALGILGAIPGTRILESQLYGVTPGDPLTLGALLVLLLAAGGAASDLPARRAASLDPSVVLRDG
jgi:predicted permease